MSGEYDDSDPRPVFDKSLAKVDAGWAGAEVEIAHHHVRLDIFDRCYCFGDGRAGSHFPAFGFQGSGHEVPGESFVLDGDHATA